MPSKNELARSCKNLARILHASLAWHMHVICPFSCSILAQSCTYLARNGARFCKSCCKNNYLHFLHILQDLARIGARLCKNRARKGTYRVHMPSKSCMQDSCKILAQSCMILQVRFCWVMAGGLLKAALCSILTDKDHLDCVERCNAAKDEVSQFLKSVMEKDSI